MKKYLIIPLLLIPIFSFSQNNCPATVVCGTFGATPNGTGNGGQFGEINSSTEGCLNGEHNSTWISINILSSGTLRFTINPNVNSNDFDFAVWGPNSPCPPVTSPIRCSWAISSGNGNTGVNSSNNAPQTDGSNWVSIDTIDGIGTSTESHTYMCVDRNFEFTINYYRLKQVDFNGVYEHFNIITIDNITTKPKLIKIYNLCGQEVNEYYHGFVIEYYEDGTIRRRMYQ